MAAGRGLAVAALALAARVAFAQRNVAWVHGDLDPIADTAAVVTHGSARFTLLSERLVRMEWSPRSPPVWSDAPTMFAINRRARVPDFETRTEGSRISVRTAGLILEYDSGADAAAGFTASSLQVRLADGTEWWPGTPATGSLHGSIRTLDRVGKGSVHTLTCGGLYTASQNDTHCESGPLSKDGWAVVDDSANARLTGDGWPQASGAAPPPGAAAAEGDVTTAVGTKTVAGGRYAPAAGAAPPLSGAWPWVGGPAEAPPSTAQGGVCSGLPRTEGYERFECIWGNHPDEAACRAMGCCYDAEAAAQANGTHPSFHMVPWCYWPAQPPASSPYLDWYFFGHGSDFRGALGDFRLVSGPVPLLPRFSMGPVYSRWYPFAQAEHKRVVEGYAQAGVPLDILVIDTDYAEKYPRGFPSPPPGVHVEPWTGYDVSSRVLPAPRSLITWLHSRGVATGFNLHLPPYVHRAGGVQYLDAAYAAMTAVTGQDPAAGAPVLGDYTNATWTAALLQHVVAPLFDLGLDFLWPDWQQGEWTPVAGVSPTLWIGYVLSSAPALWGFLPPKPEGGHLEGHLEEHLGAEAARHQLRLERASARGGIPAECAVDSGDAHCGRVLAELEAEEAEHKAARTYPRRPMVLNRWGGLGAHRYPLGFSGDAETNWDILRLQAFMTPTGANVGFQWSHDIGGFAGQPDPELFVRWVQFGALASPMLRPHCAGKHGAMRDPWAFPYPAFSILRHYYRLRAALVPYLATAQRLAYETGVVPVHALYVDHSTAQGAFEDAALHQAALGDSIWTAPITRPSAASAAAAAEGGGKAAGAVEVNALTRTTIWFPPGLWIEWFSWQAHDVPRTVHTTVTRTVRRPRSAAAETAEAVDEEAAKAEVVGEEDEVVEEHETVEAPSPGAHYERAFTLAEMPIFSPVGTILPLRTLPDAQAGASAVAALEAAKRSGAVSPRAPGDAHAGTDVLGTASAIPSALTFWVFPPGPGRLSDGSVEPDSVLRPASVGEDEDEGALLSRRVFATRHYDDDGATLAYVDGHFAWTNVSCAWTRRADVAQQHEAEGEEAEQLQAATIDSVTCSISPAAGGFEGFPAARDYSWRFITAWPPARVVIDGAEEATLAQGAQPDAWGDGARWPADGEPHWAFDGTSASVWVHSGRARSTARGSSVTLVFPRGALADDALLSAAVPRKIARAQAVKDVMAAAADSAFPFDVTAVLRAAHAGEVVEGLLQGEGLPRQYLAEAAPGALPEHGRVEEDAPQDPARLHRLVRDTYAGVHSSVEKGVAEVDALLGPLGAGPRAPLETMRALLINALQ